MRFAPLLCATLVSALAVSACTAPTPISRSEETRRQIEAQYGPTEAGALRQTYAALSPDGTGFTMFRSYSEKPMPNRFGPKVPESFDNALVLDIGVEMKLEKSFPLYRVALKPRKISDQKLWAWPSHVLLKGENASGKARKIAAKLPLDRTPDANGIIWTDWTYCADCVNLKGIDTATIDALADTMDLFDDATAVAIAPNGTKLPYQGVVQFSGVPGVGILTGDEAHKMAGIAIDRVNAARDRAKKAEPAREAYARMVATFASSLSPTKAIINTCGEYEPNVDVFSASAEAERFDAYKTCAGRTLATFPSGAREPELIAYATREELLATKAGLTEASRTRAPSLEREIDAALAMIEQAQMRYKSAVSPEIGMGASGTLRALGANGEAELEGDVEAAADAKTLEPRPVPEAALDALSTEPSGVDYIYVARATSDGAAREIGSTEGCLEGIACEVGRVMPLIAVEEYCKDPKKEDAALTGTVPGWGVVIERYKPVSKADELFLRTSESPDPLYSVAQTDTGAYDGALRRLKTHNAGDGLDFFPNYQAFYTENTSVKQCKDNWRDSGKHKVANN
jgi:hypothetical protein